ncbi:MAG TPA: 50S ribosomal protein L18 [Thermoproteota archaeon]|nr:50S ribosomal protein L18 [Thermoproteota archaeon]
MSPLRRRREGLTDYRKRKKFIQSRLPRVVCRISNKYVTAAIVTVDLKGDRTVASATSKELSGLGWHFGVNNVPASYLTGCLLARRASGLNLGDVILDIGLYTPTKGNRLFALAKGCVDSGLKVLFNESVAPSEGRIRGDHLAEFAGKQQTGVAFSGLRAAAVDPKSITEEFNSLVRKIKESEVSKRV